MMALLRILAAVVSLAAAQPVAQPACGRSGRHRPGPRRRVLAAPTTPATRRRSAGSSAADVEFYHDRGGPTIGLDALDTALAKNLCGGGNRLRREPVDGTVRLSILRNGDTVYGAIVAGEHLFYVREPGQAGVPRRARPFRQPVAAEGRRVEDGAAPQLRPRSGHAALSPAARRRTASGGPHGSEDLQHHEDDDAGDRDVQPDRKRPAGQRAGARRSGPRATGRTSTAPAAARPPTARCGRSGWRSRSGGPRPGPRKRESPCRA